MKLQSCLSTIAIVASMSVPALCLATNPASQEWVTNQITAAVNTVQSKINNVQSTLTAANWSAVCTSGSPSSATGCFGNVSSEAFTRVNNGVGGFASYANINTVNASNSVFIKAFFAGTNTPASSSYIQVGILGSAARCGLFTQAGLGVNPLTGIATNTPANGTASGTYGSGPMAATIVSINNYLGSNSQFVYNANSAAVVIPNPIYMLCVGYNTTDGSTAQTLINATAT